MLGNKYSGFTDLNWPNSHSLHGVHHLTLSYYFYVVPHTDDWWAWSNVNRKCWKHEKCNLLTYSTQCTIRENLFILMDYCECVTCMEYWISYHPKHNILGIQIVVSSIYRSQCLRSGLKTIQHCILGLKCEFIKNKKESVLDGGLSTKWCYSFAFPGICCWDSVNVFHYSFLCWFLTIHYIAFISSRLSW